MATVKAGTGRTTSSRATANRNAEPQPSINRMQLLSETVANLREGVMITDDELDWPGPRIVFVNDAMCKISGYSDEELVGQSPRILQGEDTSEETRAHIRRELAADRSCLVELVNYRQDGTPYDTELFITALFDAEGRRTNFVSVHRDISERKRAERERARLAAIVKSSEDAIFSLSLEGIIETWNLGAERLYGYSSAEAVGQPIFMVEVPNTRWGWRRLIEMAQRGERLVPVETKQQRKDGLQVDLVEGVSPIFETVRRRKDSSHVHVALSVTPISNERGEVIGVSAIARDITERRRAEAALRDSEAKMKAVLNTAADAIITIDQRGIIQSVNPATEKMFGYQGEELVSQNVQLLMPEPYRHEHDSYLARYLETGEARMIGRGRELIARHKDGSMFPVALTVSEVGQLELFTGIIRDISDRKDLQKQVLEIAAEEDRRIGHELHDNIQQQLTGLGLLARSLADALAEESANGSEMAARLAAGINDCARDVHMLSRGLVPVEVDAHGLQASLAELATSINERYGVQCVLQRDGPVEVANNFVATHLYRIAQEAVSNAIKHGRADRVEILLNRNDDRISLEVLDNGVGIGAGPRAGSGMGLRIMQYRAGLVGGTIQIEPAAERGTQVTCTIYLCGRGGSLS
jgi:PAS domain S-box-containing protein